MVRGEKIVKPCIIYGLYSSRDGELRYIGQTTLKPTTRLAQHRNYAKRKQTPVHKWFSREVSEGFSIELRVLESDAIFNLTEIEVIAKHRSLGTRLLNLTEGGEGTVGWRGNLGKKRPDLSARNKANRGKPGHKMSPETEAKLRAANKIRDTTYLVLRNKTNHPWIGKKHTEETKEKMRASGKKRKHSPEAIAALWAGRDAYYERLRNAKASV